MRRILPLLAALLAISFAPASAGASLQQESILMDTEDIIDGTDLQARTAVKRARDLGYTRLRIEIKWYRVAPQPEALSLRLPLLNFSSPAAYQRSGWAPYDRAIRLARFFGLDVYLDINGFAPRWATPERKLGRLDQIYRIDPKQYGRFAQAVGTRYSGRYPAEDGSGPLPKVWTWSLYNEPGQGGWLAPQFEANRTLGGRVTPTSPRLYREMVRAAWDGLVASGHGSDALLIGELSPTGRERRGQQSPMRPLLFLREFFCLDERYQPFAGVEAKARGCENFKKIPGAALAVHPYNLTGRPDALPSHPDDISIAAIDRVAFVLDRAAALGRVRREMPIWNTEFGWQTAPDPYLGIPPDVHADYLMRAEYLSWRNPRVKSFAQYLLRDEPKRPVDGLSNDRQLWGTWQSGIFYADGRAKPALRAVELPVQALPSRDGRRLRIWGMIRPGAGKVRYARLQVRPAGERRYRDAGHPFAVTGRGYFMRSAGTLVAGNWRFVWLGAPGGSKVSRNVAIGEGVPRAPQPSGAADAPLLPPAQG